MFKIIYASLFIIVTLLTVAIKPAMHKPLSMENLSFSIEEVKKADDDAMVEEAKNIQNVIKNVQPPAEKPVTVYVPPKDKKSNDSANFRPKKVAVKNQNDSSAEKKWNFDNYTDKTKTVEVKPQQTAPKVQKVVSVPDNKDELERLKKFENIMNESTKNPNKQLSMDEIETVVNVLSANPEKVVSQPKTDSIPLTQKVLTEQEEIIAWNKWRANLQNRVMKESRVAAPLGTVFMFSCIVDKYGNISNINAWSTNPDYTAMAKRNVKPALSALQGQSILNFPEGTRRNSTVVAGSFVIAYTDKYASENDYSDYERIRR